MRFLANENVPRASVALLRRAGYDTAAVAEDAPASSDSEVLGRAAREGRIIPTFGRDYGELIYRRGLPPPAGVTYLRFQPATPEEPGERVLNLLTAADLSLEGKFTVLEASHVRQRPLP